MALLQVCFCWKKSITVPIVSRVCIHVLVQIDLQCAELFHTFIISLELGPDPNAIDFHERACVGDICTQHNPP